MRKLSIANDPRDIHDMKTWPWILFQKDAGKLEDAYPRAGVLTEPAGRTLATMTGAQECELSS
jgi:hypothetical protein